MNPMLYHKSHLLLRRSIHYLSLLLLNSLEGYGLSAHRTAVVALQPVLNAFCVEEMSIVAWKERDLVCLLVFQHADSARLVLFIIADLASVLLCEIVKLLFV